ncbi:L,D-transpeptidase family protein [Streptomyces sp. 184]|uniref:L,D-transpeptidase family protein n=1 Tax=Streptomyces sp. 184 TaxID=1827526 RepID=UPI00389230D3
MRAYGTSGRLPRRTAAAVVGLLLLAGCGGSGGGSDGSGSDGGDRGGAGAEPATPPGRIPGVGARLNGKVPEDSRQAVAVYGKGPDSADATVVLYEKHGKNWQRRESWPAHNGKKGWTPDHREGDKRSPVGVFTLSDAGGVLADPGAKLPYLQSPAFAAPHYWPKTHWNDFDLVIAIDYNRVKGTSPLDPTRPRGQDKGGSIWFHMDHGSGTSGCVSISKAGMTELLRTLDPRKDPVAVMGDRASLAG